MFTKDSIYIEIIKAINEVGKTDQFITFGYLSRNEFDKIIKIAAGNLVKYCEECKK